MKVASTLLLTTLCCASAFGFHGTASKALKKVGGANKVPMVQPIDLNGERSSAVTVSEPFLFGFGYGFCIEWRGGKDRVTSSSTKFDQRFFFLLIVGVSDMTPVK